MLPAARFQAELHLNWQCGGSIGRQEVLSGKSPSEELSGCDTLGCQSSGEATFDWQRVRAVDREFVLPGDVPTGGAPWACTRASKFQAARFQAELHLNWQCGGAIGRQEVLSGKCPAEMHLGYDTSCCQVLGEATA